MASDNPTVAAANAETGVEPLNAAPAEPQAPKQDTRASADHIPPLLNTPGYESVDLPLGLGSKSESNRTISSLPAAREFGDLVKARYRPSGPARAEEVAGDEFDEEIGKVKEAVQGGDVKVYMVDTGLRSTGEIYVVGLDVETQRIIGVRMPSSKST
jgi:hypothetical protein